MKRIDSDNELAASADVAAQNLDQLRALFPEAFAEGKLDVQVLRQLVGDLVVDEATDGKMPDEKYGLNWKGKRRARQLALTPSLGTLRPCPEESVDWNTTKNLMIEGDNLEVLKLLQKSYSGKVKLIYIDPPYNTGKDFVYPDNFHDNIRNYLELTGQVDGEGRKITSNPESSGRFHTDWLNMMYPRLKLARNLLREDGAIFISIDDSEVASLRKICDEIFGEENFVANIVWQKKFAPQNDATYFSDMHDNIVVYARQARSTKDSCDGWILDLLPRTAEQDDRYTNPDNDPRGPWASDNLSVKTYSESYDYPIVTPSGKTVLPPEGRCWNTSQERMKQLIADGRVWFGADGNNVPRLKRFLSDVQQGRVPTTWWPYTECGHNQEAKQELNLLFAGGGGAFDTPKPLRLIERIIEIGAKNQRDAIILDFFAGSGTTGHAVWNVNTGDGGCRQHILVQLPESLSPDDKGQKTAADYCDKIGKSRSIAELTKERLRRAGKVVRDELLAKWASDDTEALKKSSKPGLFETDADSKTHCPRVMPDLGFRVFKLDSSNIRVWNPDAGDLGDELHAHVEHVLPDRTDTDLLYEMLLKLGLDLTAPIAERMIADKKVVSIGNGAMMACLEKDIESANVEELAKGIAAWHQELAPAGETSVFFRDSAFADDVAKSNLTAILEQKFQSRKKDLRIRSI